jgi:3-oxoacyl-[acyl-carrier protein] reductase
VEFRRKGVGVPIDRIDRALDGLKVLVVGGGGVGNGRAIGRAAAAAGAEVVIVDRNSQRADEAAAEIVGSGGSATALSADVTVLADLERTVDAAVSAMGGIDVLIPVVGGFTLFAPWVPADKTRNEDWDLILEVNLSYVFRLVRLVVRVFLDQGRGGSIVGVGSIAGTVSSPYAAAYGAAKAGLLNLSRSVTLEYARQGIRMNVVSCGMIATEPAVAAFGEEYEARSAGIPMGRSGTPEEVANAVMFLASPLSTYIGGQCLHVDGAVTVRFPLPLPGVEPHAAG